VMSLRGLVGAWIGVDCASDEDCWALRSLLDELAGRA